MRRIRKQPRRALDFGELGESRLGSAECTERELDRGIEVEIGPGRPRLVEEVSQRAPQGDHVVLVEGGDLTDQAAEAIGDAPLELIIDGGAGEPVAKFASLLKAGGPIVSYTARNRQPLSIPIVDLIFRGLSVHGYLLNRWLDSTPQETIVRTYRELADLVRNGTLAAPVEATYALADYREAIGHAVRNDRHGKVLFTFQ